MLSVNKLGHPVVAPNLFVRNKGEVDGPLEPPAGLFQPSDSLQMLNTHTFHVLKDAEPLGLAEMFLKTRKPKRNRAVDMDPHSFSLLDPDPGRKFFKIKTEKMQGNW